MEPKKNKKSKSKSIDKKNKDEKLDKLDEHVIPFKKCKTLEEELSCVRGRVKLAMREVVVDDNYIVDFGVSYPPSQLANIKNPEKYSNRIDYYIASADLCSSFSWEKYKSLVESHYQLEKIPVEFKQDEGEHSMNIKFREKEGTFKEVTFTLPTSMEVTVGPFTSLELKYVPPDYKLTLQVHLNFEAPKEVEFPYHEQIREVWEMSVTGALPSFLQEESKKKKKKKTKED